MATQKNTRARANRNACTSRSPIDPQSIATLPNSAQTGSAVTSARKAQREKEDLPSDFNTVSSPENIALLMAEVEMEVDEIHVLASMCALRYSPAFKKAVQKLREKATIGIDAVLSGSFDEKEADDSFELRLFTALSFRAGKIAQMLSVSVSPI